MPDWPRLAVTAGSGLAGAASGYVAERLLLRDRFVVPRAASPLGQVQGEQRFLRGPDGARLCVETYGPADSAYGEVVLVHGFSLMGRCWHEQVVALRDHLRLVTYDHPGHGRSSRPLSGKYSLELLADALATVIEQTTDATRGKIVVVGHSMGGMTALACARRHPQLFERRVGALLLLSTTAKAGAEDIALGAGIHLLARFERGVKLVAALLSVRPRFFAQAYRASSDLTHALIRKIVLVPEADPRYIEFTEQLLLNADLEAVSRLLAVLLAVDEDETLATIEVPTTIVGGTEDGITPVDHARRMARANPDVELVELPGIGHMTPLEAHEVVNALVAQLAQAVLQPAHDKGGEMLA